MLAEMWKEVLEGEGLPTRILPEGDILDWAEKVRSRSTSPRAGNTSPKRFFGNCKCLAKEISLNGTTLPRRF